MICNTCGQDRPETEFAWRSDRGRRRPRCRDCTKTYGNDWYAKNRVHRRVQIGEATRRNRQKLMDEIWAYKAERGCADCGEADPVVLQFDHLGDKKFNIADMVYRRKRALLWAEVEKCDVVCANCHARRTYRRRCGETEITPLL